MYQYKATGDNNQETTGTLDALSLQAAREELVSKGLDPIEIFQAPLTVHQQSTAPVTKITSNTAYLPLLETLRLYAGWLLAWYALIYIVGAYQFTKELPFRIPYAESLFLSPLVLSFTFAAFIFLLLSSVYILLKRNKIVAFLLCIIGVATFLLYRMNVQ